MSHEVLQAAFPLTTKQIQEFVQNGILVVDNVFSREEVDELREGMHETLRRYHDVDHDNLQTTATNLQHLSSTNGSGGVLDIFYPSWKLDLATNDKLFSIISQLWSVGFECEDKELSVTKNCYKQNNIGPNLCQSSASCPVFEEGDSKAVQTVENGFNKTDGDNDPRKHPFGPFNPYHGYAYIDRVGYRIPTALSEEIGEQLARLENQQQDENGERSKQNSRVLRRRPRPLQRSLPPHLDCCPHHHAATTNHEEEEGDSETSSPMKLTKWRPLQSFVSLTDNLEPNTGGFEAVPGFHKEFSQWANTREPTIIMKKEKKKKAGKSQITSDAADRTTIIQKSGVDLCKGAFTPLRPKEDSELIKRIQHIPCRAGSFVVWDNRIPHGNARRNDNKDAVREVVYVSFLPADAPLNQSYAQQQLSQYQKGYIPTDQWIEFDANHGPPKDPAKDEDYQFSSLGRKLMGIDPWS